jgi:hypothetical protein
MTRRTPPIPYSELPPSEEPIQIIGPNDRSCDGIYEIPPNVIHVFPFTVPLNDYIRVPVLHLNPDNRRSQSLGIRCWIATQVNGYELFFRFHPGTGGIAHVFYDKNMNPPPPLEEGNATVNRFSGIVTQFKDIPVPMIPGEYFYQVQNMEKRPNTYKIGFLRPNVCCPDGTLITQTTFDAFLETFDMNTTTFT